MSYLVAPAVTLKPDEIEHCLKKALGKADVDPELLRIYQYFSSNQGVTQQFMNDLFNTTSSTRNVPPKIGRIGYYKNINKNWLKSSEGVLGTLKKFLIERGYPDDVHGLIQPQEDIQYLMSYGNKYEYEFSSLSTNTAALTSMSVLGAHWRNQTLSNLHYTIQYMADTDPALFATLLTTKKGQGILSEYAFECHPPAYIKSGFCQLPLTDVLTAAFVTSSELGRVSSLKQMVCVVQSWTSYCKELGHKYLGNFTQSYSKARVEQRSGEFFDYTFLRHAGEESAQNSAVYLYKLAEDSFPYVSVNEPDDVHTVEDLRSYTSVFAFKVAEKTRARTFGSVDTSAAIKDFCKLTWLTATMPYQTLTLVHEAGREMFEGKRISPVERNGELMADQSPFIS